MLREKNISVFDQAIVGQKGGFKLSELMNLECIFASHNLLKDIYGICQLTTLKELNLSFNMIKDISPIEDLEVLEKLFLNRNQVAVIDPIRKLTNLKSLGLFHNEIINAQKSLEVLCYLGINFKLNDISIDGNPISSTTKFKNQLILSIPNLETLDDEQVSELDREVAIQYFEMHNIQRPIFAKKAKEIESPQSKVSFDDFVKGKDTASTVHSTPQTGKKLVRFTSGDIDDDHEGDWQANEIKKLNERICELSVDNSDLRQKLNQKHYTQVYKDNQMLQLEVKNMYILQEENKDLREDMERLKKMSYDQKVKEMAEENKLLRKRNGQLLIELEEAKIKITEASSVHSLNA